MAVIKTDGALNIQLAMLAMIKSNQVLQEVIESWVNVFKNEVKPMTEEFYSGPDIKCRTLWMSPDKMTISLISPAKDVPGSVMIGDMQFENYKRRLSLLPFISYKFKGRALTHTFYDEELCPESAKFMVSRMLEDNLGQTKFDYGRMPN